MRDPIARVLEDNRDEHARYEILVVDSELESKYVAARGATGEEACLLNVDDRVDDRQQAAGHGEGEDGGIYVSQGYGAVVGDIALVAFLLEDEEDVRLVLGSGARACLSRRRDSANRKRWDPSHSSLLKELNRNPVIYGRLNAVRSESGELERGQVKRMLEVSALGEVDFASDVVEDLCRPGQLVSV